MLRRVTAHSLSIKCWFERKNGRCLLFIFPFNIWLRVAFTRTRALTTFLSAFKAVRIDNPRSGRSFVVATGRGFSWRKTQHPSLFTSAWLFFLRKNASAWEWGRSVDTLSILSRASSSSTKQRKKTTKDVLGLKSGGPWGWITCVFLKEKRLRVINWALTSCFS